MQTVIIPEPKDCPVDRIHSIRITIRSFKGRRNVEAHIFRWEPWLLAEDTAAYDWNALLATEPAPCAPAGIAAGSPDDAKYALLEGFTEAERDAVIHFLALRYESRLERIDSCPMELPVPLGVTPLSSVSPGKTLGFIRFDHVREYPLPFTLRGVYDLAQHEPLVPQENGTRS